MMDSAFVGRFKLKETRCVWWEGGDEELDENEFKLCRAQ